MSCIRLRLGALVVAVMGLLLACSSAVAADAPLSWRPPALTNPTTVVLSESKTWYGLDPAKDYVLKLPPTPYRKGGLNIQGGRNVVMVGGQISVPDIGRSATITNRRGLLLVGQTGTVHVEGLRIDGAGLSEGIDLDERKGAIVQIENVHVGAIRAWDEVNFSDNHPDAIQTWAGPRELRVDKFTGTSDFQGITLQPTGAGPYPSRLTTLRRININGLPTAHKLFSKWGSDPLSYSDLWAERPTSPALKIWSYVWPTNVWSAVQQRQRPEGDFVPASSVGIGYNPVLGAGALTSGLLAAQPASGSNPAGTSLGENPAQSLVAMKVRKVRQRRRGRLALSIVNRNSFPVTGSVVLSSAKPVARATRRTHKRRLVLRSKAFKAAGGQRIVVKLKMSRRALRTLRRLKKMRARIAVTTTGPTGTRATTRHGTVLRIPRARR